VRHEVLALFAHRLARVVHRPAPRWPACRAASRRAGRGRRPSAITDGSRGRRASKISVTRGQTARDVLRTRDFTRASWPSQRAGRHDLLFTDFQVGLFGHVVERQALATVVFDNDLRVQIALVFSDNPALGAADGRASLRSVSTLDDLVEADSAADFGENRDHVRVPLAEHLSRLDLPGLHRRAKWRR